MPEATVDEDNGLVLGENQVRFSRKPLNVQAIPKTQREKSLAQSHLWHRVLAADLGHDPAADFFGDGIGHTQG